MTTHYVNQELAKHHHATLLREAGSHRLAKEARPEVRTVRPSFSQQFTWIVRSLSRRPATAT
jgi:hypothetical protein